MPGEQRGRAVTNSKRHFLLVGNGPYTNRGCEAIVRGTVMILRKYFGTGVSFTVASHGNREQVLLQAESETDSSITHVPLKPPKWSYAWAHLHLGVRFHSRWGVHKSQHLCLPRVPFITALEIGGDNYSLEYGEPHQFLAMDRFLQRSKTPVVLWGASIGPFDSRPDFEHLMLTHLQGLDGVFCRESSTFEYVRKDGLEVHAHQVADPAFVMPPVLPGEERIGFPLPKKVVGVNLSPLSGKFSGYNDLEEWAACCAATVRRIANETCSDVLLVPHVASVNPRNDDFQFLNRVAELARSGTTHMIYYSGADLSAAETKGLISMCCAVFVGARTHSTIAAMSTGIPTLTLAYSRKGRAIPFDVFGSEDYSIATQDFRPETVARRVCSLLDESDAVRALLGRVAPIMRERAYLAGKILREGVC